MAPYTPAVCTIAEAPMRKGQRIPWEEVKLVPPPPGNLAYGGQSTQGVKRKQVASPRPGGSGDHVHGGAAGCIEEESEV